MNKTERIAIYIDRKNFNYNYAKHGYKLTKSGLIPLKIWKSLNKNILRLYFDKSKEEDNKYLETVKHQIHHQGTWLFVSQRTDFLVKEKVDPIDLMEENSFLKFMESIDSLYGYNIKYGMRSIEGNKVRIKGVDINIVCHMMHNAFQDNYDVAILISDNEEFVPAIEMVQDEFGKQVYHFGFAADRLRATCFGNVPLELKEYSKWLKEID